MKKKTFEKLRLIIVVLLAISIGISVTAGISFIPPVAIITATALVYYLFRQIDEVVADERDYKVAGKGALTTLNIVSITLATIGATMMAAGANYPEFKRIGYLFLYTVCFILVTKIVTFMFYQKRGDK